MSLPLNCRRYLVAHYIGEEMTEKIGDVTISRENFYKMRISEIAEYKKHKKEKDICYCATCVKIRLENELKEKDDEINQLRLLGGFVTDAYFEAMDKMRDFPKAFMSFPIIQYIYIQNALQEIFPKPHKDDMGKVDVEELKLKLKERR